MPGLIAPIGCCRAWPIPRRPTYVNMEGRAQRTRRAVFPPGDAREDWTILRALSDALGRKLPYDSLPQLRQRLLAANPSFASVDAVTPAAWGAFGREGELDPAPLDRKS